MNTVTKYAVSLPLLSILAIGQAMALDLGGIARRMTGKSAAETTTLQVADAGADSTAPDQATPTEPVVMEPIASTPLPVAFEVDKKSAKIFAKRPKIALAGYNVGAFQTASISGSTSRGQGASAKMSMALEGVDEAMLQRIADAAHADLVTRLQAAGIDVVDAATLFATPEADEIKRSDKPVTDKHMDGRAPKELLVVGPSDIGVVSSFGLIPKGFNGNVGDQASAALDAIVVYPNLALDFAWTSGGGQKMLSRKVSVEGGARFALDSISNFFAVYSKKGRYVDGSVKLTIAEDIGVDDAFAEVTQGGSSNNSGAVGLSKALGIGMASRKGAGYVVAADPERYETLAMNAAAGFNAELVRQISAVRAD